MQGRVQKGGYREGANMQILWCLHSGRTPAGVFKFPFLLSLDTPPLGPPWPSPLPGVRDTGPVLVQTIKVGMGIQCLRREEEGTLLDEMALELGLMNRRR